ncbi:hypothetical protein ACIPW9_14310 [Streptomyces sp. NPDC090052]|uniref:hypothetical protein n=1 Tax=Streptomyces sp. NPDC090052 TaxID=3365931 RepID=UPI0038214E50
MDTELAELASTGATTIVTLLATDAWEQVRRTIGSLWHRVRPEQVTVIEADLTESRDALSAAREAGDEQAAAILADEWRGRLMRLLTAAPQATQELRRVIDDELRPAIAELGAASAQAPVMHAKAIGHGRVYQAGRDQHITEK